MSECEDNVSVFFSVANLIMSAGISPSYFSVPEDLYTLCVVVACIKSNSQSCFTFFFNLIFFVCLADQ